MSMTANLFELECRRNHFRRWSTMLFRPGAERDVALLLMELAETHLMKVLLRAVIIDDALYLQRP